MTALVPNDDLFLLARAGDQDALESLLRSHTTAVEAVCFRRLRSRVDAEDAVQETLVRGMRSLEMITDNGRVGSYLCRIAERVCLDMLRQGARAMPQEIADEVCDAKGPEETVLSDERDALVRQTLKALSVRQAEALWMRDALERPVPEIAQHLGVTEGSARVLLTRARTKMRDGWRRVAGLIPFAGKVPALVGKTAAIVPVAAVIVPSVLVIAAISGVGSTPTVQTSAETAAPATVLEADTTPVVVQGLGGSAIEGGQASQGGGDGDVSAVMRNAAGGSGAGSGDVVINGPGPLDVTRESDFDDTDADVDLYDEDKGDGFAMDLPESPDEVIDGIEQAGFDAEGDGFAPTDLGS